VHIVASSLMVAAAALAGSIRMSCMSGGSRGIAHQSHCKD
jgi:hypothetical protein